MELLRPKAVLVNWTPKPLETIYWCMKAQKEPVADSLEAVTAGVPREELASTFRQLIKDKLSPFFEYISMVWKFENVSRALQQQMTRSRIGWAFSIQSLRVVPVERFADKGMYHLPATVKDKERYARAMLIIQEQYNELLDGGETVQDARGILPLNVHSTITATCNLQSFIGMVNKRLCLKTQGEFQHLALLMQEEVARKMDPIISEAIGEPCRFGPCILVPENEQQLREGKLEGKSNTDHVCPLYLKLGLSEKHPEWKRVQDWKERVHGEGRQTEDELLPERPVHAPREAR